MTPRAPFERHAVSSRTAACALALCAGLAGLSGADATTRTTAFADAEPGPRLMGMGGAGVAGVADPVAAWWNPAGLYFMRGRQAQVNYDDTYGLGLAQRGWIGLASKSIVDEPVFEGGRMRLLRRPEHGSAWAITVSTLFLDLEAETYTELMPGFSVAGGLGGELALGASVYYLKASSSLEDISGSGYSATFGVIAGLPGPGRVGVSVRNALSSLSWKDLPGDRLPLTSTVGIYWPVGPRGQLRGDVTWQPDDSGPARLAAGGEFWLLPDHIAARAGVRRIATGLQTRTLPTFGVGLRWKTLDFDYAFLSDSDGPGSTHRFGLNVVLSRALAEE